MITARVRGLGDVAYARDGLLAATSPQLSSSLDQRNVLSAYTPPLIADPGVRRVITAAQAPVEALRPECSAGCAADERVAADPNALARCISICTQTGDLDAARRNASRGAFCAQVIEAVSPALGPALRSDYSTLWAQCQDDPDAFLARLRAQGIDLPVEFDPWFKRNWKYVAIGGAALLGLLIVRKLRG